MLKFEVAGIAIAQGSKTPGKVINGRSTMRESAKGLKPWRAAVQDAATIAAGPFWEPMDGPLLCHLVVYLPRPKSTKFRDYPAGPPDMDKLQRAIGDALTLSKVIADDARIVQWVAGKRWTENQPFAAVMLDKYPPEG